jgi:hypothetical protein
MAAAKAAVGYLRWTGLSISSWFMVDRSWQLQKRLLAIYDGPVCQLVHGSWLIVHGSCKGGL